MKCHNSEFKWSSTADQTIRDVDLTGKVAIVTGANTGIGIETARVLAKHGAAVIIGCRDVSKAEGALNTIIASGVKGSVVAIRLDLASLASVREFVREFKSKHDTLNILVNNAGVMSPPKRMETEDGFELQFGTNHLGHFLLFNLLVDELTRGAPSRVVSVASSGHMFGDVNFDDIHWKESYGPWKAYGQSKTANILFANELTKRYADRGITANSLHPGAIRTELQRHVTFGAAMSTVMYHLNLFKSPVQGAATSVYVATAKELEGVGGKYFEDSKESTAKPHATNPETAAKLWDLSSQLVGL